MRTMIFRIRYIFIFILFIIVMVFYFFFKKSQDYKELSNKNFIFDKIYVDTFNINMYLTDSISNNLISNFPYSSYLSSSNWTSIAAINRNYNTLCKISNDSILNQEILSIALTERLKKSLVPDNKLLSLDSCLAIIQWVEKFNFYSEFNSHLSLLYQAVYAYWMNFISNNLCNLDDRNQEIKNDPIFRYINLRLQEQLYGCSLNKSNLEKVVDNFIDRNYSRILNKLWYRTSLFQKGLIFIFVLYNIYCLYILYKYYKLKNS